MYNNHKLGGVMNFAPKKNILCLLGLVWNM